MVADPQAGYTLLEGVFVWTSGLIGHQTVKLQGWEEWKAGVAPATLTTHQQYDCHAVYGYAVWKAGIWWDFEKARGPNPNW